jgi:hypothetical protein
MQTDVPTETIASECVSQTADRLRLLKQQDFVIHTGKRSSRRHTAHSRTNDNDIEFISG